MVRRPKSARATKKSGPAFIGATMRRSIGLGEGSLALARPPDPVRRHEAEIEIAAVQPSRILDTGGSAFEHFDSALDPARLQDARESEALRQKRTVAFRRSDPHGRSFCCDASLACARTLPPSLLRRPKQALTLALGSAMKTGALCPSPRRRRAGMQVMTKIKSRYRLGVDVGGTHTDLVLLDVATGDLLVEKVSSTPKNPALGVLDGVARFVARGVRPDEIEFFAHGTTITTNALLEMRGAKVGLLITKGYRAVQEMQDAGARRQSVRLFLREAAADRAAEPDARDSRALRRRGPGARPARPRGGAPRRARTESRGRRIDRRLLSLLLHQSRARGRDTPADPRGISRRQRVAVERGAAAHPRMAAAFDDPAQCLSRAGHGALHRPSRRGARCGRARRRSSAS